MPTTQLQLNLWDELEQATAAPESADISHLWAQLEQSVTELPGELKLHTAGKAIAQIAEVFALRSDSLLSAWEEAHNDDGPTFEEDAISGLVRQTMNLDLSELMETPAPEQRQRQSLALSTESVAGEVSKEALLEAFESEIELVETQAQAQSTAMAVAHDEDVVGWGRANAQWFAEQSPDQAVSLIQLQQSLGLPMVEVWMGLLLSQEQQYQLEQRGEFYDAGGIWLQIN